MLVAASYPCSEVRVTSAVDAGAPGYVAAPRYDDVVARESLIETDVTRYRGTAGTYESYS